MVQILTINGRLFLLLIITTSQVCGQVKVIDGEVKDDSGEIVQFAYVFANQDSTNSTFTDIDGKFEISSRAPIQKLTFLHYEYEPYIYDLPSQLPDTLNITLASQSVGEDQKTWTSNKNDPVFDIIDKAVSLEHLNDPEQLGKSFQYTTYNETVVDLFQMKEHKVPDVYKNRIEHDTLFVKHHHIHGHQHLEVIETVNQRTFKYPDKNYEKVLGLKHTGLADTRVAPIYSNLHPISFYNNYFDFLDTRYATPLGKRTHVHYDFHHNATWYQGIDTIHVIQFRPSHLRVAGLTGTMYINSNNYAIQNIVVKPEEHKLLDFEISQKFEFIENKEWFPKQSNYVYVLYKTPKKYIGTIYDKKTYFKEINLEPEILKEHGSELRVCEHFATQQSEEFWEVHRIDPLTRKQKKTYLRVDTLRHQSVPKLIFKRMWGFYRNRLTYKLPFMEIGNLFQLNRFETARFGLKGSAGKDLLEVMEFNGYGAYGIRDQKWKWGAGVGLFLSKRHDAELKFAHTKDIFEPGTTDFLLKEPDFFRRIFTNRMDKYKSNKVTLSFRTPGYHLVELGFDDYSRKSLYDYQFNAGQNANGDVLINSFNVSEFSLRTRYAINEKITHTLGEVARLKSNNPIFYVNYSRGFSNVLGGDFDFHKVVSSVDLRFYVGFIGVSKITFEGGYMESDVPYPLLFNGRGGNLATSSIVIQDHFQTMGIYEFTSNRYLNIFYRHDFGSLIFAHSKFKPDIVYYQHMGWGDLDDKDLHTGSNAVTDTYNSGFFESGLGLNNFLKFKFVGTVYGGLGIGFFYRYGPEKIEGNFSDNFVYRLTYSLKFL